MTDPLTARLSELLAKATEENPYTRYAYPAQNDAIERTRATRYAGMVARVVHKALLAERAILIAERDEGRALLEPFARHFDAFAWADKSGKPFSPETVIAKTSSTSPLLLQSFRAARAYLTRTK